MSIGRVTRTLADVGPRRLLRRARFELRQRVDRRLPVPVALALVAADGAPPPWATRLSSLARSPFPLADPGAAQTVRLHFDFLHDSRQLTWPIPWSDPAWPRLWQFHLHDFEWARHWLDHALRTGTWPQPAEALAPLMDHWITANQPGRGDGWHSYTLSLRSRNWIWLFSCCPALATPQRLHSLWRQLCWLEAHPEHCHGGNHWLENLTALAIGGLQFDGPAAAALHQRALTLLAHELPRQILADGGHEERSASYHLLMLDRFTELACVLRAVRGVSPSWLHKAIAAMASWASSIRLANGTFPRFNDSAEDACPPLDIVLAFADACLYGRCLQGSDLRARLAAAAGGVASPPAPPSSQPALLDLPQTGWTLLRPGNGWELAFKCGLPCPAHLAAHAHSDLLSLDLWHFGRPVLAEVGTSVYGSGPERQFERSSAAHNTLQLGLPTDPSLWIEPVEVWAGFRAGRKARPHSRSQGHQGPWIWCAGSHDGFQRCGASHYRWLALRLVDPQLPLLIVIDAITARSPLHWRSWWHLGPQLSASLAELGLRWQTWSSHASAQEGSTVPGYLACGFGIREPRLVRHATGGLQGGSALLITVLLPIAQTAHVVSGSSAEAGELEFPGDGAIRWHWIADPSLSLSLPQIDIRP